MTPAPKTFHIKSFGCQMNVYDGERMAELLADTGLSQAAGSADADLVVLNTCHIREKAAEKAIPTSAACAARRIATDDRARRVRRPGRGREAMTRSRMIDMVVGPQVYHRLPERSRRRRSATARSTPTGPALPSSTRFRAAARRPKRLPHLQEGCDKFCNLLRRAYTRGAEISRPWGDVIAEAQALVEAGAREIVLLGQNVNAWSDDRRRLADLIADLSRIDGLERIRYTTSHPADMTEALIAAHGEIGKLMPYLHCRCNRQRPHLRAMNRSHRLQHISLYRHGACSPHDIAIYGDSSSASRRDRARFQGHARDRRCGPIRRRLFVQI